ncbi:hypothetical protein B566_EDAN007150 [Ephemera danica]|nr:hypothetical protein B566_EDAN007150 [Ephemera danica]
MRVSGINITIIVIICLLNNTNAQSKINTNALKARATPQTRTRVTLTPPRASGSNLNRGKPTTTTKFPPKPTAARATPQIRTRVTPPSASGSNLNAAGKPATKIATIGATTPSRNNPPSASGPNVNVNIGDIGISGIYSAKNNKDLQPQYIGFTTSDPPQAEITMQAVNSTEDKTVWIILVAVVSSVLVLTCISLIASITYIKRIAKQHKKESSIQFRSTPHIETLRNVKSSNTVPSVQSLDYEADYVNVNKLRK